jgi:hypothetical protein
MIPDGGLRKTVNEKIDLIPSSSVLLGLRASDDWSLGNGISQAEAFIEAEAKVGEEVRIFAEAAVDTDDWKAMAGVKWGW